MQRSTTLNLLAMRCPGALTLYEQQAPADRDLYGAGIAAHAVLQALGEAADGRAPYAPPSAIADAVVQELCTRGRTFDGVPELPLPLDAALEGKTLALGWWGSQPWPANSRVEHGLAVDSLWRPTPYGPEAWLGCILDVWTPQVVDEETGAVGARARDYKSAWTADEDDCDSLQLRIQACAILAHAQSTIDFVDLEIGNLRTRRLHVRRLWLDEAGLAEVESWRADIAVAVRVAETRPRLFRPGRGCIGCPYLHICKEGGDWAQLVGLDDAATRLAVVEAWRAELVAQLKDLARERPLPIPGGVVGYSKVLRRALAPDAAREVAMRWFRPAEEAQWVEQNGNILGLLSALKLGVGSIDALGKRLYPARSPDWKTCRLDLERATITTEIGTEFGVHAHATLGEEAV